jgi:hypothetical protein
VELRPRIVGPVLLGLAMAAAAGMLVWILHAAPFVEDEWGLLLRAQDASFGDIITPWNGHLLAVGLLFAKLSVALAGSEVWPLVVFDIAAVLICSALVYVFARPRLGPILAVAPALVPLFFAGTSTFYGTGIQLTPLLGVNGVLSLDFGLAALILFERDSRRGDILAATMLCLSLASFSYGIAFVAGAAVAVLLSRARWRRSYAVAIPALLYGAWLLWSADQRTGTSQVVGENIYLVPLYISDSLAAVGAGLFGQQTLIGRGPALTFVLQDSALSNLSLPLFLIAMEVLAVVLAAKALGRRGLTRTSLWPSLATLLALWGLQGLVLDVESRMPGDPRYLFAGAVLLAVVVSELARGVRFSRFATAAILAVAVVGALTNIPRFHEGKELNDREHAVTQAAATAIELGGENIDPEFVPAASLPLLVKTMWMGAGNYQAFAARNGSLGMPVAELKAGTNLQRTAADHVLVRGMALGLIPGAPPAGSDCVRLDSSAQLSPSVESFFIRSASGGAVALRRFGSSDVSIGSIPPGSFRRLDLPADRAKGTPWILSVAGGAPLTVCSPASG